MTVRQTAARVLRPVFLRWAFPSGCFRQVTLIDRGDVSAATTVIMCLWNRPSRIRHILEMLDMQDAAGGVRLVLWNNCKADRATYVDAIKSFHPVGALKQVALIQSPVNAGGMGRFYVARDVARQSSPGPVVFLDDDQNVSPQFVQDCLGSYRDKSVIGWWAWRILEDYFQREQISPGENADYIGTGGMVIDRSLFLDREVFSALPTRYWFIEDLWLSDFAQNKGWPLEKLETKIEFVMDETNQNHQLAGLKPQFFSWLASHRERASR